ncbi:hypothetical protein TNCV_1447411 [Trichonephila clavipes]|nr:hypothetical protein TNCV_1447411 [Trichonephila clavipes]
MVSSHTLDDAKGWWIFGRLEAGKLSGPRGFKKYVREQKPPVEAVSDKMPGSANDERLPLLPYQHLPSCSNVSSLAASPFRVIALLLLFEATWEGC